MLRIGLSSHRAASAAGQHTAARNLWLAIEQFADVNPAPSQVPICVPLTMTDFPVSPVPGFSREFKFHSYVVADAVWSPSTVRRAYISVQLRRIEDNGFIGSANSALSGVSSVQEKQIDIGE
jgi:hypothetical protein